jgi:glucose-6-phosphate isomerase
MTAYPQNLDKLPVYPDLEELAGQPYDLTLPEALSATRIASYVSSAAGFDLLYAMQRVDDSVLDKLQELAEQSGAVDKFIRMKRGEILNLIEGYASENRQVLHTAMRDVFSESPQEKGAASQAQRELKKLKEFLDDLDTNAITNEKGESFTGIINIGIGGSDLGPRAVYFALEAYQKPNRKVGFISNVDPDDAAAVLQRFDLSRTLVNVVSKSGTTLETLTNEEIVREQFRKAGLEAQRHFIAVTGEKSPMDNPKRYVRTFYMFDYIGGRYSTTSMVGGLLLGFALGHDGFLEILRGANAMDIAAEEKDIRKNPALLQAVLGIWNHNFLGCETVAILPYSQALVRFTAHLQQCDMESNGKSITRQGSTVGYQTGPVVWGEPGTNGQHAFYQLIHQGTTVVPVEFIGFRQSQYGRDIEIKGSTSQEKLAANLLAQSLALATGQESDNPNQRFSGNRPSSILIADRLTPFSMGALLAFYEAKVVFQGFIWNINSFDQEGVQLGKVLANRLLDHYAGRHEDAGYDGRSKDPVGWSLLEAAGLMPKDD